jgi:hypothetical protein
VSSESPAFPAIGFYCDIGPHAVEGLEKFISFEDAEDFSTCDSWDLKYGVRLGMLVVDANCRCWSIAEVVDLGVIGSVWGRVLRFLFQQSTHRISQKLVETGTLSLEQIKDRVCVSIQANPDDWRDDELIAGESGPPRDEQEMLDELCVKVRTSRSMRQVIDAAFE